MVSAGMFEGATAFNQPILFQHTEKVTTFASMRRASLAARCERGARKEIDT